MELDLVTRFSPKMFYVAVKFAQHLMADDQKANGFQVCQKPLNDPREDKNFLSRTIVGNKP